MLIYDLSQGRSINPFQAEPFESVKYVKYIFAERGYVRDYVGLRIFQKGLI